MSCYDELTFAPALITDLFVAHKGKRLVAAQRQAGTTPFVGGSEAGNSVTGFCNQEPLFPGNWLTVVYNGSVGHTRLQPAPFFASDDVIALEPRVRGVPRPALLVCAAIIQHECVGKYSYGVKLNLSRLNRQTIMVPVKIADGGHSHAADGAVSVDWDGMAALGEELWAKALAAAQAARQSESEDGEALPELTFAPALITDVVTSMEASTAWYDRSKLNMSGDATYPYISRTQASNGVAGFCARQEKAPEPGNALTLGLDTQTIHYQRAPFYTSQNIHVLRHPNLNEHTGLVLATLVAGQMGRFSWGGNGATLGRLRRTKIMVPVVIDDDGNPMVDAQGRPLVDWGGMERYGKALRARAERHLPAKSGRTSARS